MYDCLEKQIYQYNARHYAIFCRPLTSSLLYVQIILSIPILFSHVYVNALCTESETGELFIPHIEDQYNMHESLPTLLKALSTETM